MFTHSRIYKLRGVFSSKMKHEQRRTVLKKIHSPEEKPSMPVFQYASDEVKLKSRVYVWGFAQYGALGVASYVKPKQSKLPALVKQHRPARLNFAERHEVVDIACGYGFTVFVTKSNNPSQVFGTGLNTDSQIGYHEAYRGHPLEIVIQPAPIDMSFNFPSITKVIQVACGRAHTLILTDKEGGWGLLTLRVQKCPTETINTVKGSFECNFEFHLGNNAYGQCGRRVIEQEDYKGSSRINKINIDEVIIQILCGQDNSFFLTTQGEVYTCGWGADGQLGNGHYNSEWKPNKVRGDIEDVKIIKVSCAGDCVLALSEEGDVFGWGNSEYGQLLTGSHEQQICIPQYLPLKWCGKIVDVASAGTMCAVLNNSGQVYVWGYGLLGKGPEVQHSTQPTPIPLTLFGCNQFNPNARVTQLTCGLNHFAAITNEGALYMWGRNKMACLGFGHDNDQFFPFRVSVPAKVTKLSCGVDHTVALCKGLS